MMVMLAASLAAIIVLFLVLLAFLLLLIGVDIAILTITGRRGGGAVTDFTWLVIDAAAFGGLFSHVLIIDSIGAPSHSWVIPRRSLQD